MPQMAQRTAGEVRAILLDHEGGETQDRWFCKLAGHRPIYGPWTTPLQARQQYAKHVNKHHPELVGKKMKIEMVD